MNQAVDIIGNKNIWSTLGFKKKKKKLDRINYSQETTTLSSLTIKDKYFYL